MSIWRLYSDAMNSPITCSLFSIGFAETAAFISISHCQSLSIKWLFRVQIVTAFYRYCNEIASRPHCIQKTHTYSNYLIEVANG